MREFVKMHALGNDFAIFDGRAAPFSPDAALIRRLADRRRGIGFDQLILVEPSTRAVARLRFFNADGSESGACGNGTRCAARLLAEELECDELVLETAAGLLSCRLEEGPMVRVTMGRPRLHWRDIPLAEPRDTLSVGLGIPELPPAVAVNMGNPHAVLFVDDPDSLDAEGIGARIERHPLFPERVNVGFARLLPDGRIRLRVYERGAGLTPACGSGACAALVAAVRRGLVAEEARLILDGGELMVRWPAGGEVELAGPADYSYRGEVHPGLLERA